MKCTKKVLILTLSTIMWITHVKSQNIIVDKVLKKIEFESHTIVRNDIPIDFLIHKSKNKRPSKLVVYLQGTTPVPEPFFEINKTETGISLKQYFSSDYQLLDDDYIFVIIGLTGVPLIKFNNKVDLEVYHKYNSLNHRVFLANEVINHLYENLFELDKIIVYGHSEGAPVAAKLATLNSAITHLGFWGGNALPDFFDFILFERKDNLLNGISDSITEQKISKHLRLFKTIIKDSLNTIPDNSSEISEYTNKRWASYAEPPINDLLKLEIPIYVQTATQDESAPIESNYLIPLEFLRLGKTNLSFNVCIGCNHGFVHKESNIDYWNQIFIDFIQWTENVN